MYIHKAKIAAAIVAITFIGLPGLAMAHGDVEGKANMRNHFRAPKPVENQDGVKVFQGIGGNLGLFSQASGEVTAVNGSTITIKTKSNTTLDINAANAKFILLPNTVESLTDIKLGDKITVNGTKSGNTVVAHVIYDINANTDVAKTKGTITAVNGNQVTLQTKNNKSVNVTVNSNTEITKAGTDATVTSAELVVGSKVKAVGLWDKVVKSFSALKIKIF